MRGLGERRTREDGESGFEINQSGGGKWVAGSG
jgi:hypothetical protein